MLKRIMKNQKGFTLVELLAVIVILGIIAAIAIPSIGHIISKTNDKATVSEAVQIIDAAKMYVASEGITSDATITKTELDPYVDNIKATTTYSVSVVFDDNGHPSYTITGHPATTIAQSGQESDLLKYLGKSSADAGDDK